MALECLGSLIGLRPMRIKSCMHKMHMRRSPISVRVFWLFLTLDVYGKIMFVRHGFEHGLDLISSLVEKENGEHVDSISLLRSRLYDMILYLSNFIEPRWFELVK